MNPDDRAAICDLLNRYAEALDTRAWELLDEVFADDAVFEFGEFRTRTRAEAVAMIRSHLDGCGPTQHLLGNHRVEIDGDRAFSHVYVRAFHLDRNEASGRTYEMFGEYRDELGRTAAGWRSVHRRGKVFFELGTREVLGPG